MHRREREEDHNENAKCEACNVNRDAPFAEMKIAVRGWVSFKLTKEHEEERDHVREVEPHGGKRYDRKEGGGVSDVDKTDECGDDDDQSDGVERDAERRVNLSSRQWVSAISGSNVRFNANETLTYEKNDENGRPLSRANAHVKRDTDVKNPNMLTVLETRIRETKAVAPALDWVVW